MSFFRKILEKLTRRKKEEHIKIERETKEPKVERKQEDNRNIVVSEPCEVKYDYRPIVEKVIPELARRLIEIGIEPKNVFVPIVYGSSIYISSFGSWENLRPYKIIKCFASIDEIIDFVKKIKDEIIEVSFEWENHYAVTNYYLRINLGYMNLMIKLYPSMAK